MSVTIAGALVATTADIERIKAVADEEDGPRLHMPGWVFIDTLDWNGFHILCTRREGLPGLFEDTEGEGWVGELTLGDHLHFEGMFKVRDQKEPARQWITLTVHEAAKLEPAPATSPVLRITAIDGQTQR